MSLQKWTESPAAPTKMSTLAVFKMISLIDESHLAVVSVGADDIKR